MWGCEYREEHDFSILKFFFQSLITFLPFDIFK